MFVAGFADCFVSERAAFAASTDMPTGDKRLRREREAFSKGDACVVFDTVRIRTKNACGASRTGKSPRTTGGRPYRTEDG